MAKEPSVFTHSETDHLLRCIDLAIASNKRAMNAAKQPEFTPIYAKTLGELEALKLKLKGLI